MSKILEINNLAINFSTYRGEVKALRGLSLHLNKGESLAIVGESGSGKSVLAHSIMRLLPSPPCKIISGEIILEGEDVLKKSNKEMEKIRGVKVGMIFQDPMTSLNPTMRVGDQIAETIVHHQKISWKEARKQVLELMELVHMTHPQERMDQYPHQLSGGMRQRVMIAIALACKPQLLIADEPTTALDVTIQAQILDLIEEIKRDMGMSVILITHDLAIVSEIADRVAVMYSGKIVEEGHTKEIFKNPQHPYTAALLKAIPGMHKDNSEELFTIEGTPPDLIKDIQGCPFAERCSFAHDACKEYPAQYKISETHKTSCWLREKEKYEKINNS